MKEIEIEIDDLNLPTINIQNAFYLKKNKSPGPDNLTNEVFLEH